MLIHLLLYYHYGLRSLIDADGYVKGADHLIATGHLEDTHHLYYLVPIALLAFCRLFFPDTVIPFLFLQSFISLLSVIAIYKCSAKVFLNKKVGFMSALIMLFWVDCLHWNLTTMTESLFLSFSIFILYQLVFFKPVFVRYFLLVLSLSLGFFIRPTTVIIIVGALSYLILAHRMAIQGLKYLRYSLILFIPIITHDAANFLFSRWDFTEQYLKGNVVTYADAVQGTSLYHEQLRVTSTHITTVEKIKPSIEKMVMFIILNPVYFLKLACLKVWYLLSGIRPYYSVVHNLFTLLWLSTIYLCSTIGWSKISNLELKAFILCVFLINCSLIAVSSIDWDNRFYMPMVPGFVLLSGKGLLDTLNYVFLKKSNS